MGRNDFPAFVGCRFLDRGKFTGLNTTAPPTLGRAMDEVLDFCCGAELDIYHWCPMSLVPCEVLKPHPQEKEFCPVFYKDKIVAILTRNFTDDEARGS